ncbi:MAG TPA: trypsin-like peptidase domain-containing protein, partial [Verrucomicrobiae bacterium]|nr:trypsin-like peptidase domain-containing protein [Verrucomicrobiae bacterium]
MPRVGVLVLAGGLALSQLPLAAKEAGVSSPAMDVARQLNQAFIEVADKVSPAVVVIRVAHKPDYANPDEEGNPFFEMLPELRRHMEDQLKRRRQRQSSREPVYDGQGSGVVISEDGYILTNRHVVDGAEKIRVHLKDGTEFDDVEIKGVDPQSDVAVLKVNAKGLKAARLGDSSKTRVGEFAIAIGAPFELDYSVTFGHVSAKGRRIFSDSVMMDQDFIQTDASINPGNSGGPLVNIDGEVIGINTLIRGMRTGIGFAIPANLAKEVADQLIKEGKFTRAWLGINIENLSALKEYRETVSATKDGVVVGRIIKGGPAADSELRPADVITAVDGKPTASVQQLKNEVRTKPPGQPVTLDVVRGDKKLKIRVNPGEVPDGDTQIVRNKVQPPPDSAVLGIKVQALTQDLADRFEVELTEGVIVTEVEAGSVAERKGIMPGEIITDLNRHKVSNVKEFKEALKTADLKKGVLINLIGEGGRRFAHLKDSGD